MDDPRPRLDADGALPPLTRRAAHDVSMQLQAVAARRGDPDGELLALTCLGTTLLHLGELPRAHALIDVIFELSEVSIGKG